MAMLLSVLLQVVKQQQTRYITIIMTTYKITTLFDALYYCMSYKEVYTGCFCEHNTEGDNCEMCQTGFNSALWMPGTSTAANQCQGTPQLNYIVLLCVQIMFMY